MKNKAIFFDRDDTLLIDTNYMYKPEDLKFFPQTFKTLQLLQEKGYLLFIITNQSGIGRGKYTEAQMNIFHEKMLGEFRNAGITIKDIAFCPHAPEQNCDCRKPSPKLLNMLIKKYEININSSWMVGDKGSDIECGKNAGMKTFLVDKGDKPNNLEELLARV